MLELAVSLATGTPMWGLPEFAVTGPPERTLLIQTENDDDTQRHRLNQVLAARGLDAAPLLQTVPQGLAVGMDFSLSDEGESTPSRRAVEQLVVNGGFKNLLLDPLYDLVGSANTANPTGGGIGSVTRWLTGLQAKGCSVVISWKLDGSNSYSIRNSYGDKDLRYWLEGALITRRRDVPGHPDWVDVTVKMSARRHGRPERTVRMLGKGYGRWEYYGADATADDTPPEKPARDERLEIVTAYLAEHPETTVREAVTATGIPRSTVARYLTQLRQPSEATP